MIVSRWRTATGPIPRWIHMAADDDRLVYDSDMVLREPRKDTIVRIGDTLALHDNGDITLEPWSAQRRG